MNSPDHAYHTIVCAHCAYSFPVPVYCGNRFCPICGARRRRACREKLDHVVKSINSPPDTRLRFITLTIPNVADPALGVRTLIDSFRRLRQRNFWKSRVDGGVFVLELTGAPGNWNVHIHALVSSRWIPVKELSRHWSKVSPGRIVDIRFVPVKQIKNYLTKYITKSILPEKHQQEASDALKGTRMFQFFGDWYGLANEIKKISYECPKCGSRAWLIELGGDWSEMEFDNIDAQLIWDMQHMSNMTHDGAVASVESDKQRTIASHNEGENVARESDYLYDWKKTHNALK